MWAWQSSASEERTSPEQRVCKWAKVAQRVCHAPSYNAPRVSAPNKIHTRTARSAACARRDCPGCRAHRVCGSRAAPPSHGIADRTTPLRPPCGRHVSPSHGFCPPCPLLPQRRTPLGRLRSRLQCRLRCRLPDRQLPREPTCCVRSAWCPPRPWRRRGGWCSASTASGRAYATHGSNPEPSDFVCDRSSHAAALQCVQMGLLLTRLSLALHRGPASSTASRSIATRTAWTALTLTLTLTLTLA